MSTGTGMIPVIQSVQLSDIFDRRKEEGKGVKPKVATAVIRSCLAAH